MKFIVAVTLGLLTSVLPACGGGGGGGGDGASPTPVSATPIDGAKTISSQVVLDAGLPASLGASISQMVTPAGAAPYGAAVPVWTNALNGQTLVLALDANERVMAASTEVSSITTLSARSTARAMVLIALGDSPGANSATGVDDALSSSPAFGALVSAVSAAMAQGAPPMESITALQILGPLVGQIAGKLSPAASRARPLSIAPNWLELPLPATLVTDDIGIGLRSLPVELTASSVGTVSISNRMPIPWSVSTLDVNRRPMQAKPLLIEAKSSADIEASNQGFTILVEQNDETAIEIERLMIQRLLKTAFAFASANTCSDEALKAVTKSLVSAAPAPPSSAALFAAVVDFFDPVNTLKLSAKLGAKCTFGTMAKWLKPIASLLSEWSKIEGFYQGGAGIVEGVYANVYFGRSMPDVGVCESSDSVVINCANEYLLEPAALYMAPKATAAVTLTAKDIKGRTTLPSGGLTPAEATTSVADIDPKTYMVAAKQVGSVTLSLVDSATGRHADLPVSVVIPQISPAAVTVKPGQLFTLRMTDAQGHPVITPPGTSWTVSGQRAADVQAITLLETNTATWFAKPDSLPGTLTITANAPDGFAYSEASKAEVTISDLHTYAVYLTFQTVRCGTTDTASLTITGGGETFQFDQSFTASACGAPGQIDSLFGPLPVALVTGTTYQVTFRFTRGGLPQDVGLTNVAYEIDAFDALGASLPPTMSSYFARTSPSLNGEFQTSFVAK